MSITVKPQPETTFWAEDMGGEITCTNHAGFYLAQSIQNNPRRRIHMTSLGTWRLQTADDIALYRYAIRDLPAEWSDYPCETCREQAMAARDAGEATLEPRNEILDDLTLAPRAAATVAALREAVGDERTESETERFSEHGWNIEIGGAWFTLDSDGWVDTEDIVDAEVDLGIDVTTDARFALQGRFFRAAQID